MCRCIRRNRELSQAGSSKTQSGCPSRPASSTGARAETEKPLTPDSSKAQSGRPSRPAGSKCIASVRGVRTLAHSPRPTYSWVLLFAQRVRYGPPHHGLRAVNRVLALTRQQPLRVEHPEVPVVARLQANLARPRHVVPYDIAAVVGALRK